MECLTWQESHMMCFTTWSLVLDGGAGKVHNLIQCHEQRHAWSGVLMELNRHLFRTLYAQRVLEAWGLSYPKNINCNKSYLFLMTILNFQKSPLRKKIQYITVDVFGNDNPHASKTPCAYKVPKKCLFSSIRTPLHMDIYSRHQE